MNRTYWLLVDINQSAHDKYFYGIEHDDRYDLIRRITSLELTIAEKPDNSTCYIES